MSNLRPVGQRASGWGEGPLWHEGILYHVDTRGGAIVAFHPDDGSDQVWQVGEQVGFVVPCRSGRLLFGGQNGLSFLDPRTGNREAIADPEPDRKDHRFNDGKT